MLSLYLAGDVPLPFTPEEHVRCNCTMFEGLRRWLHEFSQDTFRILLQKHLQKKGNSSQLCFMIGKCLCTVNSTADPPDHCLCFDTF